MAIDFGIILETDRLNFNWIPRSTGERMGKVTEENISDYLTDYNNTFSGAVAFISWSNDPRYIEPRHIDFLTEADLCEDNREFNRLETFSFRYKEARSVERPSRIGNLIDEIDVRTDRLNLVLPAIKDPSSNRDLIAQRVAEWVSIPLLGYVGQHAFQEFELKQIMKYVYGYVPGKTAVTLPDYAAKLRKRLGGLK